MNRTWFVNSGKKICWFWCYFDIQKNLAVVRITDRSGCQ